MRKRRRRRSGPLVLGAPSGLKSSACSSALLLLLALVAYTLSCLLCGAPNLASAKQPNNAAQSTLIVRTHLNQLFKGTRLGPPTKNQDASSSSRAHKTSQDGQQVVAFLGIRYASAPIKRLRFMPPAPFVHAPNQLHDAQNFGPICPQRFPVDFSRWQLELFASLAPSQNNNNSNNTNAAAAASNSLASNLRTKLMQKLLPNELYEEQYESIERLVKLESSEDCLNLNIYTPEEALNNGKRIGAATEQAHNAKQQRAATSLRPVLVIIHGDSFDFGAGRTINARLFVQQTRQLVVTFNYRLNIFGFPPIAPGTAAHRKHQPDLQQQQQHQQRQQQHHRHHAANLGLLDQVAALHWIHEHIRAFGGDPARVTLMGSKQGAVFVNLLMLSPLAKGLFERAIIEDGSALSPLIANRLLPNGASAASQQRQQHLRVLARLADCGPSAETAPPAGTVQLQSTITTQATATTNQHAKPALSTAKMPLTKMATQQTTTEQWTLLECLRSRSIEQIIARIPLNLLTFNQHNELVLAPRWHRHVDLALARLRRRLAAGQLLDGVTSGQSGSANSSVSITTGDHERQLAADTSSKPAANGADNSITITDASKSNSNEFTADDDQEQDNKTDRDELVGFDASRRPVKSARQFERLIGACLAGIVGLPDDEADIEPANDDLLELLSSIYELEPTSSTTQWTPMFGPQLDAPLLHNDESLLGADLAATMLRSPFADRDLMVGVSRPALSIVPHSEAIVTSKRRQPTTNWTGQLSKSALELGLADEQAIELVGSFVRSFYRFHQQEITNSIISHYLMGVTGGNNNNNAQQQHNQQQQLAVLRALLEAFQDALVNVPVLKSALLHSSAQLDTLARAFFTEKLTETLQQYKNLSSASLASSGLELLLAEQLAPDQSISELLLLSANNSNQTLDNNSKRRTITLAEQFNSFAQSMIDRHSQIDYDENEHQQDTKNDQLRFHSTYLFQFDPSLIERHLAQIANSTNDSSTLKRIASQLLSKITEPGERGARFVRHTSSIQCLLKLEDKPTNSLESIESPDHLDYLERAICTSLATIVGHFVETGNTNIKQHDVASSDYHCLNDHHSLQLGIVGQDESDCVAVGRLLDASNNQPAATIWPCFSVFGQQLANLFAPGTAIKPWLVGPILDKIPNEHQRDSSANNAQQLEFGPYLTTKTSHRQQNHDDWLPITASRLAFWANFLPTLNCSRTRPIEPTSLFHLRSSNSTLANLNLVFSCQDGALTASSLLAKLAARIKRDLDAELGRVRALHRASVKQAHYQNHHSPRMTNNPSNSTTVRSDADDSETFLSASQQAHDDANNQATNKHAGNLLAGSTNRTLGIWIMAGLVVALVLLTTSYVIIKRHKLETRKRQDTEKQESNDNVEQSSVEQANAELTRVKTLVAHADEMPNQEQCTDRPMCSLGAPQACLTESSSEAIHNVQQQFWPGLAENSAGTFDEQSLCREHSAVPIALSQHTKQRFHSMISGNYAPELVLAPPSAQHRNAQGQQPIQSVVYAGSSSDVTTPTTITGGLNGATINGSGTKKRVKIRDPIDLMDQKSAMRAGSSKYATVSNAHRQHEHLPQQQQQQHVVMADFCPIHRRTGSASSLMPALALYQQRQHSTTGSLFKPFEDTNDGALELFNESQQPIQMADTLLEWPIDFATLQGENFDLQTNQLACSRSLSKGTYY